jgi:hypothetical protein
VVHCWPFKWPSQVPGTMATAFMLSIEMRFFADILSLHSSVVTRESIEISVLAGSTIMILEVRTTPGACCVEIMWQATHTGLRSLALGSPPPHMHRN